MGRGEAVLTDTHFSVHVASSFPSSGAGCPGGCC